VHNDVAVHLKGAKCIPHVMRRARWFGWKADFLFIKCCPKCEAYHKGKAPKQTQLHATHSGFPGEKLAVDLCGPFPASNGYKYILCHLFVQQVCKYVATALVDNVFLKYGLCHVLLSDQGVEFENEILQSILSILGVTKITTSSYRPKSNAICEV